MLNITVLMVFQFKIEYPLFYTKYYVLVKYNDILLIIIKKNYMLLFIDQFIYFNNNSEINLNKLIIKDNNLSF